MSDSASRPPVPLVPTARTGRTWSGRPPFEAVKYQFLIMFLIAGGTGFGVLAATGIAARRLFDDRHRSRLERLGVSRRP